MSVLIIAEHDNATLKPATLHTVTAAQKIGGDIHILVAGQGVDGAASAAAKVGGVAKVLKGVVDAEQPGLVILGKQAIDDDSNQTGQMLSALLGWPQATYASKLVLNGDNTANVTREVDGGLETIQVKTPFVMTTDLRLNEPRYASLPNIMKAKKKPIEALTPEALGVDPAPRLKTLKVVEPSKRQAGVKVKSAAELVEKLRNEAKVI